MPITTTSATELREELSVLSSDLNVTYIFRSYASFADKCRDIRTVKH